LSVRPKVLINALSARDGGGQTYLLNLIKYYNRKDLDVIFLLSEGSKFEIKNRDFKIHRVYSAASNPIFRSIWEFLFLPRLLYKMKIDVFFCPGGVVPKLLFHRCKIVTMFRNMIPFDEVQRKKYPFGFMRLRNWILSKVFLDSMGRSDLVIFISKFAKSVIQNKLKKPLKSSLLISHGVDFKEKDSDSYKIEALSDDEDFILYPSTIDVYKSQLEVVEAYSIALSKGLDLPKLLMAGSIQESNIGYSREVKNLIDSKNLSDRIILSGKVPYESMPNLYRNCNFVIYASKTENCPNILLEALSSGCLVLCSNIQPMPEFGEDAVIYFNPEDPADLALNIEKIFTDGFNRKLIKEKIPAVISKYSWKETADRTWRSLYELT